MKKIIIHLFLIFPMYFFSENIVHFTAVGDIMAHNDIEKYAVTNPDGFDIYFKHTKEFFQKADLAFANLETPIHTDKPPEGYPKFNSRKELLKAIKKSGINILSLANNHTMDQEKDGIVSTLTLSNEMGFISSGTGFNKKEAEKVKIIIKNNIIIGYLAITFSINSIPFDYNENEAYVNIVETNNNDKIRYISSIISEATQYTDIFILSYHIGKEYTFNRDNETKINFKKFADAGADIILGHHPHVIHGIEKYYNKRQKESLFIYSLGNFISAQARYLKSTDFNALPFRTADSIIISFDIVKTGNNTIFTNTRAIPLYNVAYYNDIDKIRIKYFEITPIDNTLYNKNSPQFKSFNKINDILLYRKEIIMDIIGYKYFYFEGKDKINKSF